MNDEMLTERDPARVEAANAEPAGVEVASPSATDASATGNNGAAAGNNGAAAGSNGAAAGTSGKPAGTAGGKPKASVADVEEALRDVLDPELGINVVDLGLLYGVHVDDENVATLDMTLTTAACPLTDVIEEQARVVLMEGPNGGLVNDVRINWVWLPPWGPDKITPEGREQLRSLGFNV